MSEPRRADPTIFGSEIGAAFAGNTAMWVEAQRNLITNVGAVMTGWIDRQRDVLDASSRAMQRLSECRSFGDLLQVQQEWATDCLGWGAAQLRAAGQDARPVTRKAATRFAEAAREETVEVRRETGRRRGAAEPEQTEAATGE